MGTTNKAYEKLDMVHKNYLNRRRENIIKYKEAKQSYYANEDTKRVIGYINCLMNCGIINDIESRALIVYFAFPTMIK